ncbi:MAG: cation:proton antiporter [Actinomycetota bacterium]|nr:cation:proton antiporter [Actinomycetota bacterium]
MPELVDFGQIVLLVSGVLLLAVASNKFSEWVPLPAPAIFLVAAAITSDVFPRLERYLSIRDVERIAVIALLVILFDGGMRIGWRRFREAAAPIVSLGLLGTFATAGLMTLASHFVIGFGWTTSGILGAAVAPTDPAVMFSVLGRHEVPGRTGTILEGESGANDPVGIALMIGMLEFATHADASFWIVIEEFAIEMSVGLAVGAAGAWLLLALIRRISLVEESLYPLWILLAAGTIYGAASVAHGSGFLAVFVAGILVGDARLPQRRQVERFQTSLSSLAEIVVFVALGLTIHLGFVGYDWLWAKGLILALILAFVARPAVVAALLYPARLDRGERVFVMWAGLKGAVPILLAAFALIAGAGEAGRIYAIVFVVVAFSVVLQGATIPFAARRLGIEMRPTEGEAS